MWLRIAVNRGISVDEAQVRVSSAEFGELAAFYGLEPWDGRRAEECIGRAAAGIISALTGKVCSPYRYMPFVEAPEGAEEQDEDAMRGAIDRFADA